MAEDSSATQGEVGERAASALAPESDLFEDLDSAGLGDALVRVARASAVRALQSASTAVQLSADLAQGALAAAAQWLGRPIELPTALAPKDRRFADPAWSTHPFFSGTRLGYAAACRFARGVVGSAGLDPDTARKASMASELLLDAVAPTNFLPLNPAALKRAFDTGGVSLARGARNFVDDLVNNGGRRRQVDASGLEVGDNLAATPAKVVFRNELMELLQYEPQTEQVHA